MKENIIFIFLSLAYYVCLQLHLFLYESHNFVFFVAEEVLLSTSPALSWSSSLLMDALAESMP